MSFGITFKGKPCPTCGHYAESDWSGMTYNLAPMFREAGFYDALYEGGKVSNLRPLVEAGLADMRCRPEVYRAMNPPNGWGDYEGALEFTQWLAVMCTAHQDGTFTGRW